tara:strand:- start:7663 stop:7872 length:210 start_codon:yes stop_codon:yes gene_type:complete
MALTQTTVRFKISADGIVSEEVIGVACNACELTTKNIEKNLGEVSGREYKSDYYEPCPIDKAQIVAQAE